MILEIVEAWLAAADRSGVGAWGRRLSGFLVLEGGWWDN